MFPSSAFLVSTLEAGTILNRYHRHIYKIYCRDILYGGQMYWQHKNWDLWPSLVLCWPKCIESVRQSLHNGSDVTLHLNGKLNGEYLRNEA